MIELEKNGSESAVLQIVGDEEIYGEQVIVEASMKSDVLEVMKRKVRQGTAQF